MNKRNLIYLAIVFVSLGFIVFSSNEGVQLVAAFVGLVALIDL